jgi:hypothetical protein
MTASSTVAVWNLARFWCSYIFDRDDADVALRQSPLSTIAVARIDSKIMGKTILI